MIFLKRTFQLTRRIMTAWYQNIVYSEYLPPVIGSAYMQQFQLNVTNGAYFTGTLALWNFILGYNASLQVAVSAEFSSAAFRFGHSQIRTDHWRTTNASVDFFLDFAFVFFSETPPSHLQSSSAITPSTPISATITPPEMSTLWLKVFCLSRICVRISKCHRRTHRSLLFIFRAQ